MFLTTDQLAEMTGYKNRKKQADWLSENGYEFDIRADGRPNVLIDQVRERQCKGATARTPAEPNLAALDRF